MIKARAILFFLLFLYAPLNPLLSEDKSKDFYAGPLSDTPKTIQMKADQEKIKKSQQTQPSISPKAGGNVKKEPFSFGAWLRKVLGYE